MDGKILLVAIACLLLAGCVRNAPAATPSPTAQPSGANVTVTINDGFFSPATVTVGKGGSVTWFNNDVDEHALYFFAEAGVILSPGESFTKAFAYSGNQTYAVIDQPANGSESRFEGLVVVT